MAKQVLIPVWHNVKLTGPGNILDVELVLNTRGKSLVNAQWVRDYVADQGGGGGGGGGETNTASNLGAGRGVFSQKVDEDLQFKSLVFTNGLTSAADTNEITISGENLLPAASYTAADVFAKVLTLDTNNSTLNANFLQGNAAAAFVLTSLLGALSGVATLDGAGKLTAAQRWTIATSDVTGLDGALAGKQPIDQTLTAFAALTFAAGKVPYGTGDDLFALADSVAYGRSLLNLANAGAAQTLLALQPGLDVQAYSPNLDDYAALTITADAVPYGTGPGTLGMMTVTAAARTLLDDATTGTMLTTLGASALGHTHPQSEISNLVTDLAAKAAINSQAFTGTPTVPDQAALNNSSAIANTRYVDAAIAVLKNGVDTSLDTLGEIQAALALKAPLASPTFTGTVTVPTPLAGSDTTVAASTEWVRDRLPTAAQLVPDFSGATNGDVLTIVTGNPAWTAPAVSGGDVPAGGTIGQALVKSSGDDFDTEWATLAGGGGGEANTAANLGSGSGWFSTKVGIELRFKSFILTAGGSGATLTSNANDLTLNLTATAPLASPALTGTPTAPTAAGGTSTTQIATTAFVQQELTSLKAGVDTSLDTLAEIATALALKAPLASPALTGVPTAPTASPNANSTQIATTAYADAIKALLLGSATAAGDTLGELEALIGSHTHDSRYYTETEVDAFLALKAPLASPALTGTPTAPNPANTTVDTTQIATTAWVQDIADVLRGGVSASFDTLQEIITEVNLKAPLASPALTGTPTAPTASNNTNTTQIATTAYIDVLRSTTNNIWAKAANKLMLVADWWDAAAFQSLTDAATVTLNFANGHNWKLLATSGVGNTRTLGAPSNARPGATFCIRYAQDATGGRALVLTNFYRWDDETIVIDTAANAVVHLFGLVDDGGDCILSLRKKKVVNT
jgi:hypothetical protein